MTIERLFYGYMVLVGIATGMAIVLAPQVMDFWLKPYFWVLIAVALFDGALLLIGRAAPNTMLPMNARMIGFVVGILLMGIIPNLAGSPARFF